MAVRQRQHEQDPMIRRTNFDAVESNLTDEQAKIEAYTEKSVRTMDAVGFGGSVYLIFLAPLVLLFSYTRIPKNKQFSMLIPMIAIGLILVLYLEGFYRGVGILAQQQGFSLGEILSGM